MTVSGVIAEFNPFHNGHEYLLGQAKKTGDAVVAVMSGNFVQRGEPAIMPAADRVRAALLGGADLVAELPLPWAMATAQRFALGGVSMLDGIGITDRLVFGSESGNTDALRTVSQALEDERVTAELKRRLSAGEPFAAARQKALEAFCPRAGVISQPNDTLGVEYINALRALNSSIIPFAVKRVGVCHDGGTDGSSASGSAIRKLLAAGEDVRKYASLTADAVGRGAGISDPARLETAILYKMRTITADELRLAPDISEGIENRIIRAAAEASTLEELFAAAKTKRYSHARIRRIVMSAFLGLTAADGEGTPPYFRVLGFNSVGRGLLKEIDKKGNLPIIMKYTDIKGLDERAVRCWELTCSAADVFGLTLSPVSGCGSVQKYTPVIL